VVSVCVVCMVCGVCVCVVSVCVVCGVWCVCGECLCGVCDALHRVSFRTVHHSVAFCRTYFSIVCLS